MAVEILFLSLVLRKKALSGLDLPEHATALRLFRWEPDWFREDDHLLATTFMSPSDTRRFGNVLEARTGLQRGPDWVVVDMATGPTFQVPWLEWRNGYHGHPTAWDQQEEPARLASAPSMIPGASPETARKARICKLFGRDSGHDANPHRENFGRFLPDWGGRDLWLFADPDPDSGPGEPIRWASINLNHLDLSNY